ncbi:hypothetical protein B296_00059195 [Ensete ventricosum]|uniref:Uncharacterized protein n=1 Tax=Ensete ventricosum TaxID=4639 RepID=A0A426XE95_ENSVE|nr:hypothetical protein B296_00059195 [Ensete ventricosum]
MAPGAGELVELPPGREDDESDLDIAKHRQLEGLLQQPVPPLREGDLPAGFVLYPLHLLASTGAIPPSTWKPLRRGFREPCSLAGTGQENLALRRGVFFTPYASVRHADRMMPRFRPERIIAIAAPSRGVPFLLL